MFRGDRLRELRKEKNMTLAELAKHVELTAGYLSNLENGRYTTAAFSAVSRLADFFGVDYNDLDDDIQIEKEPIKKEGRIRAEVLRELREKRGLSLNETAKQMGLTPSYLSLLENGKRQNPGTDVIEKILAFYEITVDTILHGSVENVVDLEAMLWQADLIRIDGRVIDVRDDRVVDRLILALKMGAAWANELNNN